MNDRLFAEYDVVRLLLTYNVEGKTRIRKGTIGTIVYQHLYDSERGHAYEVEFDQPSAISVETIWEAHLEKAILDPVNWLERWLLSDSPRRSYFAAHFVNPQRQVELFNHARIGKDG